MRIAFTCNNSAGLLAGTDHLCAHMHWGRACGPDLGSPCDCHLCQLCSCLLGAVLLRLSMQAWAGCAGCRRSTRTAQSSAAPLQFSEQRLSLAAAAACRRVTARAVCCCPALAGPFSQQPFPKLQPALGGAAYLWRTYLGVLERLSVAGRWKTTEYRGLRLWAKLPFFTALAAFDATVLASCLPVGTK